jgi:hypothetical protein
MNDWRRIVAKSRGLPPSFQLDVPQAALDGPVQLGDYLDEEVKPVRTRPVSNPPKSAPAPTMRTAGKVVEMPRPAAPWSEPIPQTDQEEQAPEGFIGQHRRAVPRKQVNMNPETLRMVDELLQRIQDYSVQRDAKVSEMFHALVSVLYEARELINFAEVQPRGKWGSPTARAFPVSLKNAFRQAIAEWKRRNP